MLYKTAICNLPGTGSPNYFNDTGSREVPFAPRSKDSPLERVPQIE